MTNFRAGESTAAPLFSVSLVLIFEYQLFLDKIIHDKQYRVNDCLDDCFMPAQQTHKQLDRSGGYQHLYNGKAEIFDCRRENVSLFVENHVFIDDEIHRG